MASDTINIDILANGNICFAADESRKEILLPQFEDGQAVNVNGGKYIIDRHELAVNFDTLRKQDKRRFEIYYICKEHDTLRGILVSEAELLETNTPSGHNKARMLNKALNGLK